MRTRRGWWRRLLVLAVVVGAITSGCSPLASKGTLPPPGTNGQIDESAAPDFLAVAGQGAGIAGYARKEDVLGAGNAPFPVYGDDLRTVVGQMVPGKGFVPLDTDPGTVPTFSVSAAPVDDSGSAESGQVALYVRNDTDAQAWVTVLVDGKPWNSTGFWSGNLGVGCYAMPRGSRLVLDDRSPDEAGASILRQFYVRGAEAQPPSLWLTIGKDGAIEQGTGVPPWWGEPQTC